MSFCLYDWFVITVNTQVVDLSFRRDIDSNDDVRCDLMVVDPANSTYWLDNVFLVMKIKAKTSKVFTWKFVISKRWGFLREEFYEKA